MSRPPYNIPAINNRLESLAIHLGVDSETIEQDGDVFHHQGTTYVVSRGVHSGGTAIEFNSSMWTIATKPMPHTPGPWTTSRDAVPEGHVQITVYSEATGERVATVFETPANANIIAASPELLKACQLSLRNVQDYIYRQPAKIEDSVELVALRQWRADLEAAIAKATEND